MKKKKKQEQERFEKTYTSYLGQGSIEKMKAKPWWWDGNNPQQDRSKFAQDRVEKQKRIEDPLQVMARSTKPNRHNNQLKRKISDISGPPTKRTEESSDSEESSSDSSSSHHKNQKKRKKKEKTDELEKLRAQRLMREKQEEERIEKLLKKTEQPKVENQRGIPRRDFQGHTTSVRWERGGGKLRNDY